jgi:hypothetical protein
MVCGHSLAMGGWPDRGRMGHRVVPRSPAACHLLFWRRQRVGLPSHHRPNRRDGRAARYRPATRWCTDQKPPVRSVSPTRGSAESGLRRLVGMRQMGANTRRGPHPSNWRRQARQYRRYRRDRVRRSPALWDAPRRGSGMTHRPPATRRPPRLVHPQCPAVARGARAASRACRYRAPDSRTPP